MTEPLTIGVQLYSVRDALEGDHDEVLARIAAAGYDVVEPFGILRWLDTLPAAISRHGLRAESVHAPLLTEDADRVLDATEAFGASTVFVPSVDPALFSDADGVQQVASELNAAAERAAARGLKVGYHNHHFEFLHRVDGTTAYEAFVARLDPAIVLELDTYWAAAAGQDVVALLGRLGDRVSFAHLKDGPIDLESSHVAIGEGAMPIWDIIDAAKALRVGVVELDSCDFDPLVAVERSHGYLRTGRAA